MSETYKPPAATPLYLHITPDSAEADMRRIIGTLRAAKWPLEWQVYRLRAIVAEYPYVMRTQAFYRWALDTHENLHALYAAGIIH